MRRLSDVNSTPGKIKTSDLNADVLKVWISGLIILEKMIVSTVTPMWVGKALWKTVADMMLILPYYAEA